jgi:hypothetical protein
VSCTDQYTMITDTGKRGHLHGQKRREPREGTGRDLSDQRVVPSEVELRLICAHEHAHACERTRQISTHNNRSSAGTEQAYPWGSWRGRGRTRELLRPQARARAWKQPPSSPRQRRNLLQCSGMSTRQKQIALAIGFVLAIIGSALMWSKLDTLK